VRSIAVCLVIQCFSLAILFFSGIGFDHPGRFGLDFEHGVMLGVLYVGALIGGVLLAVMRKQWIVVAAQLVIPAALVFMMHRPPARLEASQYRGLVGKTKDEARSVLRGQRVMSSGFVDSRYWEGYNGLTVWYSDDGRVLSVEAK
jgi:hypothetical protein